MSESIIPGAVTVAVTSGKGGVGKTTTTVAIAAALANRGVDVIVIDGDLHGPNVHLVAELADTTVGVDAEQLLLHLPKSPFGFRVISPVSLTDAPRRGMVSAADLIGVARFTSPAQVVIVDLPPGWTDEHAAFDATLPEFVLAVVAPTETAIADHQLHLEAWKKGWDGAVNAIKDRDRRRKVVVPEGPNILAIETMARFTGIPEDGGDPVVVRRIDAVDAEMVAKRVDPVVSVPSTASMRDAAATPEISKIADIICDAAGV